MVIVVIKGGFGNQLFQIGFARMLQSRYNYKVKIDISFFNDQDSLISRRFFFKKLEYREFHFKTNNFLISNRDDFKIVFKNKYIKYFIFRLGMYFRIPKTYMYSLFKNLIICDDNIEKYGFLDNAIYDGYWQNKKYFLHDLPDLISYTKGIFKRNLISIPPIISLHESIVIHVRKGDYLNFSDYVNLTKEYYIASINYIIKNIQLNNIIVCTDDRKWCEINLRPFLSKYQYIYSEEKNKEIDDFSIMLSASYLVISNSTFSFWAAFLGSHKIVCVPSLWYKNMPFGFLNDDWIQIKV